MLKQLPKHTLNDLVLFPFAASSLADNNDVCEKQKTVNKKLRIASRLEITCQDHQKGE